VYPALLPLMRTPRLPVVDCTDAPGRFKWTRPFRRKTKSGFCACAITFQLACNGNAVVHGIRCNAVCFRSHNLILRRHVSAALSGHLRGLYLHKGYPEIKGKNLLQSLNWEVLGQPTHSPDLAHSDLHLFLHLKKYLADQKFHGRRRGEKRSH